MDKLTVTFDKESKETVLSAFNKEVDVDGFIYDKDTDEQILTPDGQEVTVAEFGGLKKGSEIYLKGNLTTLMKLSKNEL